MNKKLIIIISILLFVMVVMSTAGFVFSKIANYVNDRFYLKGEENEVLEIGNIYKEFGFVANFEENMSPKNIIIKSNLDTRKIGEYQISYTLKYKGYTKKLIRNIKIVDSQKPTIELNCEKERYVALNNELSECTYSVSDNYDKNEDLIVKVDSDVNLEERGDYVVKYTVTDSSNNSSSEEVKVYVRDKFELNYIVVYISKQRLEYYENNELVLSTPVTTGRKNATKTGNFKVWKKVTDTTLKGKDYTSKVKYWMAYNGNSFGIHDASWRRRFGTTDYYTNGSHGCVNVPTNTMQKLYEMVEVGTPVYIKD